MLVVDAFERRRDVLDIIATDAVEVKRGLVDCPAVSMSYCDVSDLVPFPP
jgi:hypothetical protein